MNICDDCPMRLFNNKHYNLQGIGNPYFGNCIVVPNVDYNAYKKGSIGFSSQVEIIKDILHLSTGEGNGLEELYIVPLIRCNESISCELDDNSYNRCLQHFANDVRKYNFKNILLLGDAGRRFLNCDISDNLNALMISQNGRFYNVNYSPLVKYTNEKLFETFKHYLRVWFYWCKSKEYHLYRIVKL